MTPSSEAKQRKRVRHDADRGCDAADGDALEVFASRVGHYISRKCD